MSRSEVVSLDTEKGQRDSATLPIYGQSSDLVSGPDTQDLTPPPDGGYHAWMQVLLCHISTINTWGFLNSFGVRAEVLPTASIKLIVVNRSSRATMSRPCLVSPQISLGSGLFRYGCSLPSGFWLVELRTLAISNSYLRLGQSSKYWACS